MSIFDGRTKLSYAAERLKLRWLDTEEDWRDAKRQDFESEKLEPLQQQISAALGAMERLAELLGRAEADCS